MQTLPLTFHQELDCVRQKQLRTGAQPRRTQRRFKLSLRRR